MTPGGSGTTRVLPCAGRLLELAVDRTTPMVCVGEACSTLAARVVLAGVGPVVAVVVVMVVVVVVAVAVVVVVVWVVVVVAVDVVVVEVSVVVVPVVVVDVVVLVAVVVVEVMLQRALSSHVVTRLPQLE